MSELQSRHHLSHHKSYLTSIVGKYYIYHPLSLNLLECIGTKLNAAYPFISSMGYALSFVPNLIIPGSKVVRSCFI